MANKRRAIVLKGYPRLSETFIAQEILGLEQAGFELEIWSLRRPTDGATHSLHRQIAAPVHYLPEYLYREPLRVLKGFASALRRPGLKHFARVALHDLWRDPTPNRLRRCGQGMVLARELSPDIDHLHVHFLHTPASVARYASLLRGGSFSFSAHAKDIWTTSVWEKREKIADAAWGVTCTCEGHAELTRVAPPAAAGNVKLVYHGLDLNRFPLPPARPAPRDGADAEDPVRIVTIGRMVAKKGFADLIAALAMLPPDLAWRMTHIGGGELKQQLQAQARAAGLESRIDWLGAQPQERVIAALRDADLFALACREGDGGDRDGLPNVLMEAASQALPIVSTRFAGVPEFVTHGENGLLVAPGHVAALAQSLHRLIGEPALRGALGDAARKRVVEAFSFSDGIDTIAGLLAQRPMPQSAPVNATDKRSDRGII